MKGKQYLNVGDVVTFGHLGGHDVAPGQLAPKQPAEFQFVVSFLSNLYNQLIISNADCRMTGSTWLDSVDLYSDLTPMRLTHLSLRKCLYMILDYTKHHHYVHLKNLMT